MTTPQRLLPSRLLASRLLGASSRNAAVACCPAYTLGHPGRPSTVPTLLIPIFDNSGSVTWPAGTDPLSNRFAEVDRAFSSVARHGSRHELGAVLHFDTPSSCEVEPVPITRAGLRQLRQGLRIPPDGAGSSQLAPSLRRACQIVQTYPNHEATLVVLSDFLILDARPAAVLTELASFPGTVHAVVLGSLKDARIPRGVNVTRVGQGDVPGAVAKAVFASLTRYRPGSRAFQKNCTAAAPSQPDQRRSSLISQPLRSRASAMSNQHK